MVFCALESTLLVLFIWADLFLFIWAAARKAVHLWLSAIRKNLDVYQRFRVWYLTKQLAYYAKVMGLHPLTLGVVRVIGSFYRPNAILTFASLSPGVEAPRPDQTNRPAIHILITWTFQLVWYFICVGYTYIHTMYIVSEIWQIW